MSQLLTRFRLALAATSCSLGVACATAPQPAVDEISAALSAHSASGAAKAIAQSCASASTLLPFVDNTIGIALDDLVDSTQVRVRQRAAEAAVHTQSLRHLTALLEDDDLGVQARAAVGFANQAKVRKTLAELYPQVDIATQQFIASHVPSLRLTPALPPGVAPAALDLAVASEAIRNGTQSAARAALLGAGENAALLRLGLERAELPLRWLAAERLAQTDDVNLRQRSHSILETLVASSYAEVAETNATDRPLREADFLHEQVVAATALAKANRPLGLVWLKEVVGGERSVGAQTRAEATDALGPLGGSARALIFALGARDEWVEVTALYRLVYKSTASLKQDLGTSAPENVCSR